MSEPETERPWTLLDGAAETGGQPASWAVAPAPIGTMLSYRGVAVQVLDEELQRLRDAGQVTVHRIGLHVAPQLCQLDGALIPALPQCWRLPEFETGEASDEDVRVAIRWHRGRAAQSIDCLLDDGRAA